MVIPCIPTWPWQVCLLLTVIMHNRGHWVIENPVSSLVLASNLTAITTEHIPMFYIFHYYSVCLLFPFHIHDQSQTSPEIEYAPRLANFLRHRGPIKVTTWLGMFGAKTPKAIKLFSDDGFIQRLYRIGLGAMVVHISITSCLFSDTKVLSNYSGLLSVDGDGCDCTPKRKDYLQTSAKSR